MNASQLDVRVLDSPQHAKARRHELRIDRETARRLGRDAVHYIEQGWCPGADGHRVVWSEAVSHARDGKVSISPDTDLPDPPGRSHPVTLVEIANETTLAAAHRLVEADQRPLVLNMANGVHPGGGFLHGSRAQEESLCRSSALYATLAGDPMYAAHARQTNPGSTAWAILSRDVPVFRDDNGDPLDEPWLASFITCAAPVAPAIGQPTAGDLLDARIGRLLQVARAHGYTALVLGAWGCGAFGNDPDRTARDFRRHLVEDDAFEHVVFAITDWSTERRLLGPFVAAFAS